MAAIAERRDDLSSLVSNANQALGAIASETASFDAGLQLLPPTLRQANTTFVNLRAALDDVDPLVNAAKPATEDLAPFLRRLRPVAARAVPVFRNLSSTVSLPGPDNDLAELVRSLVPLHRRATPASRSGVRALDASQPFISFARAYSPDLLGAVTKLGQVSGLLRRQRPLRARPGRRLQPLPLGPDRQPARADPAVGEVRRLRDPPDLDPLPRRRHPAALRLEPVPRRGAARAR